MKVVIFGTGYLGLVHGAVLADAGHHVMGVDIDHRKIENLTKGVVPIYEPGLQAIVTSTMADGRLSFTTDVPKAIAHGSIIFIAVGTPSLEDGSADLEDVLSVAQTIANHLQNDAVIVNKSTVPVGTADKISAIFSETLKNRGLDIAWDVVSNPEFLKEGAAVADCQRPDRIIIGTQSQRAEYILRELYEPFNRNHDRLMVMDVRSAEMTKYAANCMLATKISFMNEMANLAEIFGADIESVRHGIGSDHRIGYDFIYPGAGYGGSCFPKDVRALLHSAQAAGFEPHILNAVETRNETQKRALFQKVSRYFGGKLSGKTLAVWGLSFKPNTDDMREAPSRVFMEALWAHGAKVQAFDPQAMHEARRLYGDHAGLVLCDSKEDALKGADALAILTEWRTFKAPDFQSMREHLKSPVIFDGRNLYEPKRMRERGFEYFGMGR